MHGNAERISGHTRNRIQVFHRIIERPALKQGLVDVRQRAAKQDCVTVRPRATAAAPIEPPAPPLFSTTTAPSRGFTLSAQGRPTASYAPPGGQGITSRIGRDG